MYKIGFYNKKIDKVEKLNMCDIIFDDFEKLKNHIRSNDTIILASPFSLYDIDIRNILTTMDDYNINIVFDNIEREVGTSVAILKTQFQLMLANMQYIKDNKEIIKRLLD